MQSRQGARNGVGGLALALLLVGCSATAAAPPTTTPSGGASPVPSTASSPSAVPSVQAAVRGASPASAPSPTAGPLSQSQVNLVYATNSGEHEFLSIAQQQGYFQQRGLTVQMTYSEAQVSIASLASGDAQLALVDGLSAIQAVASGVPIKVIAYFDQTNPYAILSGAAYPTPNDLKGKTIAIGKIGDASDVSARIGLSTLGLRIGQDVTAVPVGTSPDRYAVLQTGQVAAAMDDATAYADQPQATGMHVLVNLQAQQIPYAASVLVVQDDWGKSHPDVVEAALEGMLDGAAYFADPKNAGDSQALIGQDLGLPAADSKVLGAYDAYHTRTARDPYPDAAGIQTILTALQGIAPGQDDSLSVDSVIDATYVQGLRDQGFQPSE